MDYNCAPYNQMLSPAQCASPLMQYPTESLEDMYPDIYRVVYPRVRDICLVYDVPGNHEMHPYPSRAVVERMVDEVYRDTVYELGYDDNDNMWNDNYRQFGAFGGYSPFGFYSPYGFGRPFLRDLIAVLLIRNLLGRRGIFHY